MANDLYGQIARILQTMTHRELSEAPQQIAGLVVANGEGLSKRERIDLALANLTQAELARFALKFAAHRGDVALDELGRRVLEAGDQPLSHITRRDIARAFGDNLAGERGTVEVVERYFPFPRLLKTFLEAMAEVYEIKSLSTWMSIPATGRWNTYLVRSAHSLAPLLGLEHCSKKLFTLSPGRETNSCRLSLPLTRSLRATDMS